ncbi:hypothetical protein DMN91_012268 [Ooceraea biroi]|uniref:Uncharacterized protein n=1 Tax=Ooceraea biroi TaxID=2015173 RepID=A0A026W2D3_OOCBI|nr:uncharacterized protein LOC113563301 [Ooceraea biroi]EZA50250.1 hypothetical protein X777_11088 [Ooceraea biroi]RLU15274.1 hypothetical protein DMN91_012268 [Ooceraea biroi]
MLAGNAVVISEERRRCADLRDRFAARRHVTEKYYDCLQCAEQCRHVDSNNAGGSGASNSNNNIYYYSYGNNCHGGKSISNTVVNRIRGNHGPPLSHVALHRGKEASPMKSPPPDEVRRIRNLMKNNPGKSLTRYQSAHLTPAKKRSSLARPVRIHDTFVQPRRLMPEEEEEEEDEDEDDDEIDEKDRRQDPQQRQQAASCKNPWWWQDHRDRQQPNASNYAYHRDAEDGSAGWPIRLRFEQMLELTLPQTKRKKKKKKKKKPPAAAATTATATATMMLMKQQQRSRHNFKDTERLLKVLSINNVDQDNRYNVKRCSVM